jgi:hypothetical protein
MTHHNKKARKPCAVFGCSHPAVCKSRCLTHYGHLRKLNAIERQKELEKPTVPARPRFEWAGDEESLAAKYGGNQ